MINLVKQHVQELGLLCQKHHVQRLELFGSAVTGRFDTQASDLGFLVEFLPLAEGQYADAYFNLLFDLRDLFGREVDLVTVDSIKNPYFIQAVNRQKELLYAA